MADSTVKKVLQKNVKNQNILLVNSQSNQPIYKKELTMIGEKGEKACEA